MSFQVIRNKGLSAAANEKIITTAATASLARTTAVEAIRRITAIEIEIVALKSAITLLQKKK